MNNQSYYTGRLNDYPDTMVNASEASEADAPVIPLPNPGEGGPVDNGMNNGGSNIPMVPLPNPGEGGPVANIPSGGGGIRPDFPSGGGGIRPDYPSGGVRPDFPPIFRPVFPGGTGSGVTVIPGVTFPCFNCTSNTFGRVRFLNAATGYQPFYVYLGNWLVASQFGNGDLTRYVQSASGTQTVTVSGANGYVYIQKSIQVRASSAVTIAIINTTSGLDIMEISDISCNAPSSNSCLRTCNLSSNLGPFDVSVGNQSSSYTAFTNVRYREVTPYTSFFPGWYQLFISRTGAFPANTLTTASANMSANTSYTLYIFNAPNTTEGLRTMVVSN